MSVPPELVATALEAAAKSLLYTAILIAIGASTTRWLLPHANLRDLRTCERWLTRLSRLAVSCLLVALLFRAWTHTVAVVGVAASWRWESLHTVAVESRWGRRWQVEVLAAGLWLLANTSTRLDRLGMRLLTTAGALATCAALTLSGHAAGDPARMVVHTAHLFGAGFWLGTLAVLVWLGRVAGADVRVSLFRVFSPVALAGAGIAATAGVVAAVIYVGEWSNLWRTAYGRALSLKVALVCGVAACGYANWRSVSRQSATEHEPARLAGTEMVLAVAVVLVTAILTELEHP